MHRTQEFWKVLGRGRRRPGGRGHQGGRRTRLLLAGVGMKKSRGRRRMEGGRG